MRHPARPPRRHLARKRANAAERARIKALAREDRIQSQAPTDADVWC
jgi:hypothetical protein